CTVKARASAVPSATWPTDLEALPPGWVQSGLATGAGSVIGSAAAAGSTSTSPSLVSTAMRSPRTGVLADLPFLNTPQLLAESAAAIRMATRTCFLVIILGPTEPERQSPRWRRRRGFRRSEIGRASWRAAEQDK